jgi:regulator of sigma E protease
MIWLYQITAFLVVLTILVFVHELGHYWVARRCGVRVEVFSIGFGRELFGWTDRNGTRWKFSAIPLGGYVKMFGDADAASTPGAATSSMTPEERAVSFHHKTVGQRAAVVFAGPLANFLFAIVVYAGLFMTLGERFSLPVIGQVVPNSAAEQAGLQAGDRVVSINGSPIERFEEIQEMVLLNLDQPMRIVLDRGGRELAVTVAPSMVQTGDSALRTPRLGIVVDAAQSDLRHYGPLDAIVRSVAKTWSVTTGTLLSIGQMIVGRRDSGEIGGPLRIMQLTGEVATINPLALLPMMAFLSIGLGLINLFPIPLLDGGHLLFYAIEAVRGRPLGERAQEYGFRIGMVLVMSLMLFATWNDLVHLRVVQFFVRLVS